MNFFRSSSTSNGIYSNSVLYQGLATQGEGIDLRIEMHQILYGSADRKAKGHWVVLRSYDRSKLSSYYNKLTKEGIQGPAYDYTDYLLRTRRVPVKLTLDPVKAGLSIDDKYTYYFEYTVKPKRGDHIIELSIDDHTFEPTITQSIMSDRYIIKAVHPYRLENGNVQYYSVQADFDEITP